MKIHIETAALWDAVRSGEECPLCHIQRHMERQYVEAYLGETAMQPDSRIEVNKKGFCARHSSQLYRGGARLPLALQLHTYMGENNKRLRGILSGLSPKGNRLKQAADKIREMEKGCVICGYMQAHHRRYLQTLLQLYAGEREFRRLLDEGQGCCLPHLADLLEAVQQHMSGKDAADFTARLADRQNAGMKRLEDELLWFTKKFDYMNRDEPWGTSRDSIPRTIRKLHGETLEREKEDHTDSK